MFLVMPCLLPRWRRGGQASNGFEVGPERQLVFGRLINDKAGLLVERDGGLISNGNLQSDARQTRVKCFDRRSLQKSRTEVPTSKSFRDRQAMDV